MKIKFRIAQSLVEYALLTAIMVLGLVFSINALVKNKAVENHFNKAVGAITAGN